MPIDYTSSVVATANKYGVDPNLALSVMQVESGGNPSRVSSAGAIGLFQLMPGTASGLGVDPNDPLQNIDGGIRYLAQLLNQFGGNVSLALAGYNAGPGNVTKYGGIPPFTETQNYVDSVLGLYNPTATTGDITNVSSDTMGTTSDVSSVFDNISSSEALIALGVGLVVAIVVLDRG